MQLKLISLFTSFVFIFHLFLIIKFVLRKHNSKKMKLNELNSERESSDESSNISSSVLHHPIHDMFSKNVNDKTLVADSESIA